MTDTNTRFIFFCCLKCNKKYTISVNIRCSFWRSSCWSLNRKKCLSLIYTKLQNLSINALLKSWFKIKLYDSQISSWCNFSNIAQVFIELIFFILYYEMLYSNMLNNCKTKNNVVEKVSLYLLRNVRPTWQFII